VSWWLLRFTATAFHCLSYGRLAFGCGSHCLVCGSHCLGCGSHCLGFSSPFHRHQEHDVGAVVEGGGAVGQLAVNGRGDIEGRVEIEGGEQVRKGGPRGQDVTLGAVVAAGPPPT